MNLKECPSCGKIRRKAGTPQRRVGDKIITDQKYQCTNPGCTAYLRVRK